MFLPGLWFAQLSWEPKGKVMDRCSPPTRLALTALAVGLMFPIPVTARAADAPRYTIKPIVQRGDPAGDLRIKSTGGFEFGTLNDKGQVTFVTPNSAGGGMLVRYAGGVLTPIAVAGRDAPVLGTWPQGLGFDSPVSMNQSGNIVFNPGTSPTRSFGTFRWDAQTQQVTPVAVSGMPAGADLTFAAGGGSVPVINNHGEIAFVAQVKEATGAARDAVFLGSPDGKLQPVALAGQALPGGGTLQNAMLPALNDAGVVAFLARPQGQPAFSGYVWEQGALAPVALVGGSAPGGGQFDSVLGIRLDNQSHAVLVAASLKGASGTLGLYRWAAGQLAAAVAPGQAMPGGGQLKSLQINADTTQGATISCANEKGEYAFLAQLKDGATAAYLLGADGQISLVLKSGTTTELGPITSVGKASDSFGVGLNSADQVAFVVRVGSGPDTMVLLSPAAP